MDEIIVFHFLSLENIVTIVDLQVERINERLAEQNLRLELTNSAKRDVAENGYNPDFGARPLQRLLQQQLLDPLAKRLIEGDVSEGDSIRADWREGQIHFIITT